MNQLPSEYQQFIHLSRYARHLPDKKRRESWEETVDRYVDFFNERFDNEFDLSAVKKSIFFILVFNDLVIVRFIIHPKPVIFVIEIEIAFVIFPKVRLITQI